MDPQQELFSAILVALKNKYKGTGIGVYDTFLPPKGTPYPFIYLVNTRQVDRQSKSGAIGTVYQSIHVWHDNPRRRGDVSQIMLDIKEACRCLEKTTNFGWVLVNVDQQILPDDTTKQPLLHGVLELGFLFS